MYLLYSYISNVRIPSLQSILHCCYSFISQQCPISNQCLTILVKAVLTASSITTEKSGHQCPISHCCPYCPYCRISHRCPFDRYCPYCPISPYCLISHQCPFSHTVFTVSLVRIVTNILSVTAVLIVPLVSTVKSGLQCPFSHRCPYCPMSQESYCQISHQCLFNHCCPYCPICS